MVVRDVDVEAVLVLAEAVQLVQEAAEDWRKISSEKEEEEVEFFSFFEPIRHRPDARRRQTLSFLFHSSKLSFVDVDGDAKDARSGTCGRLRPRRDDGLLPRGGSGAPRCRRRRRRGRKGSCRRRRRHRRRQRRRGRAPPSRARLRHVEASRAGGRRR